MRSKKSTPRWAVLCFVAATLGTVRTVHAGDDPTRTAASADFKRGLALARNGELHAAVEAFDRAYRTSPHHTVLYNLAQAYVSLGKPVEAVDALERYLREGGEKITPARRREVEELLERERGRIGRLELAAKPEDAELFIDDRVVEPTVDGIHTLTSGQHLVAARKPGWTPRLERVEIRPNESVRIMLALEAETPNVGQLAISCALVGVEISVDGQRLGNTPLAAPLLVATGTRTVRFARIGYRTAERPVTVDPTRTTHLDCPMVADPHGTAWGTLKIVPTESYARVSVDGSAHRGQKLAPGPHMVRVEREGFRPWTQAIVLESGSARTIAAVLEPTPERRAEVEAADRRQQNVALGVGAAGLALTGTSVALFVWNQGRYDDWQKTSTDPNAAVHAADVQRTDDIATGFAIAGAAALVTAGVIWLTSGEPP